MTGVAIPRLCVALVLASCSTAPDPPPQPPPPPTVAPPPQNDPPAPEPSVAPIPPAPPETNVFMQLAAYQTRFSDVFAPSLGETATRLLAIRSAQPIAHDVFNFTTENAPALVTVGLARREQTHAHGETPKFVELLAEPPRVSEHVAKVLTQLGSWLHDPERPINVRFRAYEPMRVEPPVYDLEHFILVPAVTARIDDRDIQILRVIPAAPDEFAHIKMRGDGAARAWWHERRGDKTLGQRWAPAFQRDTP